MGAVRIGYTLPAAMNFEDIKELVRIVAGEASLDEVEVERSGVRVRIKRSGASVEAAAEPVASPPAADPVSDADAPASTPAPPPAAVAPPSEAAPPEEPGLAYVTSPIVGTFYRSPSPDADPFVSIGDTVAKGDIVCIIEAMKLMNEIEAEASGEIVSVFVENNHPVEYGERLFAIRPR